MKGNIKHYVSEMYNDFLEVAIKFNQIEKANMMTNIMHSYERGLISTVEALRALIDIEDGKTK